MIKDRFGNVAPPDRFDGHHALAPEATAKSTSRGFGP
jgi:hypothetical protein